MAHQFFIRRWQQYIFDQRYGRGEVTGSIVNRANQGTGSCQLRRGEGRGVQRQVSWNELGDLPALIVLAESGRHVNAIGSDRFHEFKDRSRIGRPWLTDG